MQQEDKELFQSYEIKNWNYSPRLFKILGAAAVLNLVTLFVMGQAEIFTTRGCDSPMVSRVCQVLDTVYIGSILLGTERDYVDKDYEKTELANADITYIDVSGVTPPLSYPAGYFALANPESQYMVTSDLNDFSSVNPSGIPGIPGFPSSNPTITGGTDLTATPQVTPTPNNKAITGKIPTSPFIVDDNPIGPNPVPNPTTSRNKPPRYSPRQPKRGNTSPPKLTDLPDDTTAENKLPKNPIDPTQPEPKSEPVTEVEINKRPIKDLGVFVNGLLKNEKVKFNLETEFEATAKGKLTKEGKLDPKTYKIEATSADPNMVEVVEQSIEAINDAGYLKYLKDLSGRDLNLLLKQDGTGITAVVQSELESKTRADVMKQLLTLAIKFSKDKKTAPDDKDDLELLNGATVETDGKKLIIKFTIPKQIAQEMIKRKLLEEANKPQTNNTAQSVNTSQTITK